MKNLTKQLWTDECGFLISAELILIISLGVIGSVIGLTCLRNAVTAEFRDLAGAIRSLDQSYSFTGQQGCWTRCGIKAWTSGSSFIQARVVQCNQCGTNNCTGGCGGHQSYGYHGGTRVIPQNAEIIPAQKCPQGAPCEHGDQAPCDPCEVESEHIDEGAPVDDDTAPPALEPTGDNGPAKEAARRVLAL